MCRIVSFVSCKGGIGKSSLIMGLAIELSHENKKVCVVDGYFGLNGISLMIEKYFGLNTNKNDFKNYLIGKASSYDCLIEAVHNLFYLKTNSISFDYLAHSELIKFFIEMISEKFDYILIDVNTFNSKCLTMFLECSNEAMMVVDDSEIVIRNSSKVVQKLFMFQNLKCKNIVVNKARIIRELNHKILNERDIEELLNLQVIFVFPKMFKNNVFNFENKSLKSNKFLQNFVCAFLSNRFIESGAKKTYKGIGGFIKKRLYEKYE